MNNKEDLRGKILSLVSEYCSLAHENKSYKPGDPIRYAGRVYDVHELQNLVSASLDFWLTSGEWANKFETRLAQILGVKFCSLVNSGSSANFLAFMALTQPELKSRRILKGDEVITAAAGFPTTIAPIIQYGAVPVFIDVELDTCNVKISQLEEALSPRTKAVMLAHTLGNPFNLAEIKNFCEKNNLWLIEDNCDSLGSEYLYNNSWHFTGTIGDIATSSFYPPHHITMGEGGAVYTNNYELHKIVNSLRDWGRDCWCPSGQDGTCGKRFSQQLGTLPFGYDHKYTYSHFGYNLKATDLQASIGCAQLEKLSAFTQARWHNWQFLRDALSELEDLFILPSPERNSKPSWFGFLLTVKDSAKFSRDELVKYLESQKIQTRMLFAGNITRHPCFNEMRDSGKGYRIIGNLENTDIIMSRSFWIGVYPGMNDEMLKFMADSIKEFALKNE
ncbi:MAG: lipopolysaccharide biosynthesis protein RfbH [Synergistaceae bacterium]|nr:lipopolysaccharide biosynthesis protein RfbH [Synergistaceae bacterium]